MKIIILILLNFTLIGKVNAQSSDSNYVQIQGRVFDSKTLEPIRYLMIFNKEGELITECNFNGEFSLKSKPKEKLHLVFNYNFYKPKIIRIKPKNNQQKELEIALKEIERNYPEVTICDPLFGHLPKIDNTLSSKTNETPLWNTFTRKPILIKTDEISSLPLR